MRNIIGRLAGAFLALALGSGIAAAQSKVTIAVGGSSCLCYLPTVLARQLGEYDKAGVAVELVDLKGGSDALKAVLGGSADVVSGYFDHCVNLAAKKQELQSFVVYDRYPGLVLVVSPKHTDAIKSIKVPVIEVHLSDPMKREPFRHISFVGKAAIASFAGHGAHSYTLALDAAAKL